jgi:hypothetical protein
VQRLGEKVRNITLDDRVDAALAAWLASAQTPEALEKIGREVHRVLALHPRECPLVTKVSYTAAFLERLVALECDDLFREFCAEHVDMVREVLRICVDRAELLVTPALADKLLSFVRSGEECADASASS